MVDRVDMGDMGDRGDRAAYANWATEGSYCLQLKIWIVDRTPVLFCATGRGGERTNRS